MTSTKPKNSIQNVKYIEYNDNKYTVSINFIENSREIKALQMFKKY